MIEKGCDLKSLTKTELGELIKGLGEPAFRAGQIWKWIYRGADFDGMTDQPAALRRRLEEDYTLTRLKTVRRLDSKDGTIKYLFEAADGALIESVLMSYRHGETICISTQVGCNMGCAFCASTLTGKNRDLTPGEMADQIIAASRDSGRKISNVVLMGMGEPLENFENVCAFLNNARDPDGLNIGIRHISLSTCGLCDKITELGRMGLGLTLSVSLHAPNDELRSRLMPVNRRWNIAALMEACRLYTDLTGRRISFEYALIDGLNDTPQCAAQLSSRLRGMLCHVNLIPINRVDERGFAPSPPAAVERFRRALEKRGLTVTVRRKLGSDIDAACGQLRRRQISSLEG